MPPGIYAPSTPAASLKAQRPQLRTAASGSASGIGAKTPPMFGGGSPAPASSVPPNPTQMTTIGGATQQTDQMGRVITSSMGGPAANGGLGSIDPSTGMLSQSYGRAPSSITIEDPDQVRRSRDLADEQTRMAMYQPRGGSPGAPPAASPPIGEIPWSEFEPKSIPREPGLTTMPREVGKGPEDRTAADSAIFARAAERIGRVGAGNLRSLRSQMTRRGISGTGIEAEGVTAAKNTTAGELGDVIRDQAIEGLRREQDVDDRDLAAGIAQRGQDLGIASTNYSGGISQRGQDISQADWRIQALPSILALMRARQGA